VLHTGNVLDAMAAAGEPFDLVSISNIADWMTPDQFRGVVLKAVACLAPGGALLARTATGRSMIRDIVRENMAVDEDLLAALPTIERGPWFRTIGCGFRRSTDDR